MSIKPIASPQFNNLPAFSLNAPSASTETTTQTIIQNALTTLEINTTTKSVSVRDTSTPQGAGPILSILKGN